MGLLCIKNGIEIKKLRSQSNSKTDCLINFIFLKRVDIHIYFSDYKSTIPSRMRTWPKLRRKGEYGGDWWLDAFFDYPWRMPIFVYPLWDFLKYVFSKLVLIFKNPPWPRNTSRHFFARHSCRSCPLLK